MNKGGRKSKKGRARNLRQRPYHSEHYITSVSKAWSQIKLKTEDNGITLDGESEGQDRREGSHQARNVAHQDNLNDDETDPTDTKWRTHFGDFRERGGTKDKNIARFLTHNIGGFPDMGSVKFLRLKEELQHIDCVGLSEMNRNWYRINAQDSMQRRAKQWWTHHKTTLAWLQDYEWPHKTQQGGVSLSLTTHKISAYAQERGQDSSGLGRWCWHTIEGHSDTKTAVIQVYRPTRNTMNDGSTFRQQQAASGESDPIKIFDQDLIDLVDTFTDDNFRIILMGDFNTPLRGTSKLEKELNARGIHDAVQLQFAQLGAPNTYVRGSQPIDAIFVSETIEVIQAGYDRGYNEISDHRAVWADLTMESLLGLDRGDIPKPKARKLQITNRIRTLRFNRVFMQQILRHKLLHKARELEEDIGEKSYMTKQQQGTYEGIDEQRGRATACAEEKCVKLPSNDSPFSEKLKQVMGMAIIRNQIRKRMDKQQRVHTRWIIDMKKEFNIQEHISIPDTLEQARAEANQAHRKYKEAKANAPELRAEFLDLLIQQAEDKGQPDKVRQLREIKEREQQREAHTRIKSARGQSRGGGVKFVHTTQPDGQVLTVKNKRDMEAAIAKANQEKLQAANESPVRQGELRELLTWHDYAKWEELLEGKITLPDNLEQGTRMWLNTFHGIQIEEEKVTLEIDDYIRSWTKAREHTSSAPGALHFGTFKAMQWCTPAAELHAIMARIPIKTGYTPRRWTTSTDSMLPKKTGEWRPHKLRLTSLLQPDFNHNNKILGRLAMKHAERKKLLAQEQYGSRKNLSAEKHALNKRLLLDIWRLEKRPAVLCANDAKSCYDRILHIAAYLSLRRAGLPKPTVISMLEPIRRMEHRVRTAYGDSDDTYGGDNWDIDPSGICQGNGAGPAIWALVSSPLFECLRRQGFGAKMYSTIGKKFLHLAGFAFVDDADTIQTGEKGESPDDVLKTAQRELDLWEELIRATGGGLDGEKSDFAIVGFEWKNGKWRYRKKQEQDRLTVRNDTTGKEPLKQLGPHEARRTLGVWQAVDGNERTQTAKMKEKAAEWSRAIARSSLTRCDTILGAKTSLYPSLTYGLMATTLSQTQCEEIFTPIRKGVLPKAGYARTMPAVMVHGPKSFGGIGLKDLHTLQGIAHIKTLMDEAGTDSPTGTLMEILIEGHTLEIGRSGQLFSQPYQRIKDDLTASWMQNTLEFADQHKIHIQGQTSTLDLWRENDAMLMDALDTTPGIVIEQEDRQAFQRCRLHLQANTLSDITNGQGTHILTSAWQCHRVWDSASSVAYEWPFQPRPSKADRQRWQKVLTLLFDVCHRDQTIGHRLGRYNRKSRRHSKWFYDPPSDSIYQQTGNTWTRWKHVRRRTRSRYFQQTSDTTGSRDRRWHTATVIQRQDRSNVILEGHGATIERTDRNAIEDNTDSGTESSDSEDYPSPLVAAIHRIPKALRWAVERCKLPLDHGRAIAAQIIRDNGKCISDGSTNMALGTSAAISVGVPEEHMYIIYNRTPGTSDDVHSYRSELTGILANVLVMNCIASTHDIQHGIITIACDNESALWAIFGDGVTKAGDPSCDLIRIIRHAIQESPMRWRGKHVRGHQDSNRRAHLDEWALANIRADTLAKEYWEEKYQKGARTKRPQPTLMPGERWRISTANNPSILSIDAQLYDHVHYEGCMAYWTKKGRLAPNQGHRVEWHQYKGALGLLPLARRQWTQKHFSGFEGTNSMLHKWGRRTVNTCPNCAAKETHRHVTQCQSNRATQAYRNIERDFESWLKVTTSRDLRITIMAHLDAYRDNDLVDEVDINDDEIRRASLNQQTLGPNAFAEGLLVKRWESCQREYMAVKKSKRCPSRWVRELIKKLWNVSWDMWDSRNQEVHRHQQTRRDIIIAQLDTEIRAAHSAGTQNAFMPPLERRFFRKDIDKILEATEYQKRTWLHIATRYNKRDRQRVARNQGTRLMREWLKPGSTGNITLTRARIINSMDNDMKAPDGTRRGPLGRRK